MNVNIIKTFIAKTDLSATEQRLKERIVALDSGISAKRAALNELLSQIGNLEKSVNAKNTELFSDNERLAELCDLVIQLYPGEEVV